MWASGEYKKTLGMPKAAMKSKIFVGPKEDPVAIIERGEVLDFLSDDFTSQLLLWKKWKKFGLPFEGTWFTQPTHIVEMIETIDDILTNIGVK